MVEDFPNIGLYLQYHDLVLTDILVYRLMVLKVSSKFELRRFCRTTGAIALVSSGLKICLLNSNSILF